MPRCDLVIVKQIESGGVGSHQGSRTFHASCRQTASTRHLWSFVFATSSSPQPLHRRHEHLRNRFKPPLSSVEQAVQEGSLSQSAAENIRVWLTEDRYRDYRQEVIDHVDGGKVAGPR